MSYGEEEKHRGDGKGFAGLSSMVSDVDATVTGISKQIQREASTSSSQQSSQAGRAGSQEQQKPTQQTYQAPAKPSGGSSSSNWLFGIAAVIGVIWIANQSDKNNSSRPAYSPGPSSTSVAPTPAWKPPAAQPQAPSRPAEDKPSFGRNNVLSTTQIRYCLAEKIRLDAAETVIDNYVDSDVVLFNGYVNDYNSRCGEFRYRQGTLESAQRDVEPYRSQLQAEGRSRFVHSPPVATRSQAPANAWVSGSTWYCNDGYRKIGNECVAFKVPANAWVSGSTWYCNDGYRKIGNECVAFKVPANAWVSGSTWYCNDGYRKIGNECVFIFE